MSLKLWTLEPILLDNGQWSILVNGHFGVFRPFDTQEEAAAVAADYQKILRTEAVRREKEDARQAEMKKLLSRRIAPTT